MAVRTAVHKQWWRVLLTAALLAGVVHATPALVEANDLPDGEPAAGTDAGDSSQDDSDQNDGGQDDGGATGGGAPAPDDPGDPAPTGPNADDPADADGPVDAGTGPAGSSEPPTGSVPGTSSTTPSASDGDTAAPGSTTTEVAAPQAGQPAEGEPTDSGTSDTETPGTETPGTRTADSEAAEGETSDGGTGEPTSSSSAVQDAEVVETQVAVSNTGRNLAVGNGTATTADGALTISTGSATAVGNDEQTEITQEAVTALSGQASAEIIQISIVFNIGGAFASSGSNAASNSGAGNGSTTSTGSALAIGNDSETYLTQAGTANAASGHSDSIDQRVLVLQIGVAASDSGNNTIVATVSDGAGGPSTIASGDATAIGNQSDTSIEQIARVVGSGHAELTVEQWATVLNLGVALANTGANQVGDMFAALLADPDADGIRELFEVLLPALLAEPGAPVDDETAAALEAATSAGGAAGGDIATGDALAIGNRSETHVQQVAVAVASGNGRTGIRQEVVAVNAGAAGANSGGNRTGAGLPAPAPALTPAVQSVVEQLSNHVAALIQQITGWARGTATDVESTSLSARVGQYLIGLDGVLSTSSRTRDTGGGLMATIRQLSAVFNLGVAIADTGNNVMISVSDSTGDAEPPETANAVEAIDGEPLDAEGPGPAATRSDPVATAAADASAPASTPRALEDAAPATPVEAALELAQEVFTIVTGDASARNSALIVVCQRVNSPDHECLAPPDPPVDDPTDPETPVVDDGGEASPPLGDPGEPAAPAALDPPVRAEPVATPTEGRPTVPPVQRSLPDTGVDSTVLLAVGFLLLLGGALLTSTSRRRSV